MKNFKLQSTINIPNINGHTYTVEAIQSAVDILNTKEVKVYVRGEPVSETVVGSANIEDGRVMVSIKGFPGIEKFFDGYGRFDVNDNEFDISTSIVKTVDDLDIELQ